MSETDRLARSLRHLDDRIRRWSPTRWEQAPHPGDQTRAHLAYELAAILAELAREAGTPAPDRLPPRLPAHAIADQLSVLGQEVLLAPAATLVLERARAAVKRTYDALG